MSFCLSSRAISALMTGVLAVGGIAAEKSFHIPPSAAQQSSLTRRIDLGDGSDIPLCRRIGAIALALAEPPPSRVFYIRAVPQKYLTPPFEQVWTRLDAAALTDVQLERIASDRHFYEARRRLYPRYHAMETDERSIEEFAATMGRAELLAARDEGRLIVETGSADLTATGEMLNMLHVGIAKSVGESRERIPWSLHIVPTDAAPIDTEVVRQLRNFLRVEIVSDIVRYGGRNYLINFNGSARYFSVNHSVVSLLKVCPGVALSPIR